MKSMEWDEIVLSRVNAMDEVNGMDEIVLSRVNAMDEVNGMDEIG